MNQVYYQYLDSKDVSRIQRLELFDELEEWHLIQGHYCIAVAINDMDKVVVDDNNVENGVMDDDDNEESSVDEDGMNLMSPVSQALYQGYKKKVLKSNDICHREVQRGLLRLSLIVFMIAIAIAFGNIFSDVIALVGAFSMSTLAFILPSSFFSDNSSIASSYIASSSGKK